MAHAEGWIEAYSLLEEGKEIPADLLQIISSNRSGLGETMLHWYCIEGDLLVVEKIIELGFDVDEVNEFDQTPLFECVLIGRWDIARLLVSHGADPNIRNQDGDTILMRLAFADRRADLEKLLKILRENEREN